MAKYNFKHGLSHCSLYNRWQTMLVRCNNPKSHKYGRYGARGIKVCNEWKDFKNFLKDMGHPPFGGATIDRINVDGNYEPSNCRWTDQKTQQNNRKNTRKLTFNGQTLVVTKWAEITGISQKIIRQRIDRDGWSIKKALTKGIERE